jgi:hypothetical protein
MQRKSQYDALLLQKHPELFRKRLPFGRPWHYYAILASLVVGLAGLVAGSTWLALAAAGVWLLLTARFVARRLRGNTLAPRHVAEMVVTSALIPPLSVFWRLYGAAKFRAAFF